MNADLPQEQVEEAIDYLRTSVKRAAPNPIDDARHMRLLAAAGMSQAEIARLLNTTRGLVSQRMGLLKLIPEIQSMVEKGELNFTAARSCCQLTRQEQMALLSSGKPITAKTIRAMVLSRRLEYLSKLASISSAELNHPALIIPDDQVKSALNGYPVAAMYHGNPIVITIGYSRTPNNQGANVTS